MSALEVTRCDSSVLIYARPLIQLCSVKKLFDRQLCVVFIHEAGGRRCHDRMKLCAFQVVARSYMNSSLILNNIHWRARQLTL